jgi:uncharacterized Zn finger protein
MAERRARAASEAARLAKRRGRLPEPAAPARRGRQIAATFWGRAWCDNLERYMDHANRLPRGRSYVRNGLIVDLAITAGKIEALVAGSDLYTVRIGIARMKAPRWHAVVGRCTGRIASLVGLLRGELSEDVLATLVDARQGLFPEPSEITMTCSCPDWAAMCKHVAATLYGVGVRLDERPELFFTLRQVDQRELLTSATSGAISQKRPGAGKRLAASRLADVFGIELEDATGPPASSSRSAPPRGAPARARPVGGTARRRARPIVTREARYDGLAGPPEAPPGRAARARPPKEGTPTVPTQLPRPRARAGVGRRRGRT